MTLQKFNHPCNCPKVIYQTSTDSINTRHSGWWRRVALEISGQCILERESFNSSHQINLDHWKSSKSLIKKKLFCPSREERERMFTNHHQQYLIQNWSHVCLLFQKAIQAHLVDTNQIIGIKAPVTFGVWMHSAVVRSSTSKMSRVSSSRHQAFCFIFESFF